MAVITIDHQRCKGCGLCVRVCPKAILGLAETTNESGYHPAEVIKEGCIACTNCAMMCPDCCITVAR